MAEMGACLPCPPGSFALAEGATSCQRCASGSVQPATGATSCATCPLRQIAPFEGRLDCTPCPAGSLANVDHTTCTPCPAGTAHDSTRNMCAPCEAGKIAANPGAVACYSCPLGTFSNTDRTTCTPCPTGFFTLGVEAAAQDQCLDCNLAFSGNYALPKDLCAWFTCAPYLSPKSPSVFARMIADEWGDGTMYVSGGSCGGYVEAVAPWANLTTFAIPAPLFGRVDNTVVQRVFILLAQAALIGFVLATLWIWLRTRCNFCARSKMAASHVAPESDLPPPPPLPPLPAPQSPKTTSRQ